MESIQGRGALSPQRVAAQDAPSSIRSRPSRRPWRAALLAGAFALLALTGCDRNKTGDLPAVSGEAVQAQKARSVAGFGLVNAYPDQHEGQVAIALEFSQPLVESQDFDKLIHVSDDKGAVVSGSWVLDEHAKILRFPSVEAARDYTVKIDAGLLAAAGGSLGKAVEQVVHTGQIEPAVAFASQGSVLPAKDTRGLPVVSINVPEVDVEFLRVRESQLPRFFAQYQRGGSRGAWSLDEDYSENKPLGELADSVYLNRFVLGGKPNERMVSYLPVQDIKQLQEPGLYFAVMKRVGRYSDQLQTAFFSVSDLGLHARAYKDTLFVHTASLADGSATGGAQLRVLDAKGETVLKGETDGNGNALLKYTLNAGQVLVASRGKDVTLLPFNQPALDLSEFAVAGREQAWFDVFAWSGRDLYRPGETVRVSALLRDFDGKPVKAGQPLYLRLKQPDGKIFRETRLTPGEQGYFAFEQAIPVEAPTGRWQVEFRTDPASAQAVQGMTLRIEEFLPERMKLDLSAPEILKPGQGLALKADAAYLYGAPADGNRFTAKLAVAVEQHPLDKLPGWFFGDATVDLPKEAKDVVDATFDAKGHYEDTLSLPDEVKPVTPVAAIVTGSVYETGGRTVNRSLKRVLWPADVLAGVRPLFDDKEGSAANGTAGFEIARFNAAGARQPGKGLKVTLVRERRDYHWTHDEDTGWSFDYTQRFENVDTKTVDVGGDAVRVDFPVEWGGYRLEVFDPATGLTTRYPFTAGWSWNDDNRGLDARPDKVKLSLDKTGYRAGDTLKVTLTPPHDGKGVLMVESDHMLYVKNIEAKAGSVFEIPVTPDWERHDVYVTALVFRGGSAPSKITPARAVGVAHVPMDRSARRVAVGLKAPEQMKPGQDLAVTVSVPQLAGKDAHVTVSAVDVGILNITRYPVPDATAHFFAQRRLGVDSYDVYGRVIESYEGDTAKLRFGGDMALGALPQARRPTAKVQTVDLFAGPVKLDAKGNARVLLKVPDFNGTLRVSALVYSDDHYGSRDTQILVRAPVVAEASMPRVLAPGDRSMVTLDVQNFTGRPGTFRVQVDGTGPLAIGEGSRSVSLADGAKTTLSFPLQAREGYTTAQVRVRVDGAADGFKVDRSFDLPVRAGWPSVTRTESRVIDPLAPVTMGAGFADGLMPDSVRARMVVSALPPIPFAAALEDLLKYPYGCIEQTTSKGYAALVMDQATADLLGTKGLDPVKRRERMEGAFARIASMQVANGNFSMWGDDGDVVPYITPYVADFLLDAREGGFAVPDTVLQKALNRLSEDLLSGGNQFYGSNFRDHLRFANQAYAGYVLARVGRAPLGTLRALYDNDRGKSMTGLPLVQLGLALSLQGDTKRGARAIALGFDKTGDRPEWLGDYGTRLRDDALMLALVRERKLSKPEYDARVIALGRELDERRKARWFYLSTQEQVAIARLGKSLLGDAQAKTLGGTWSADSASETVQDLRLFARSFDMATLAKGVSFSPQGQPPLYASLEIAGVPRTAPAEDQSKIGVTRRYYATDGSEWKGGTLKEGEALIVGLRITADTEVPDALLTDLLPAGLEIENFNLSDAKQWADVVVDGITLTERGEAAEVKHEEFRDDRYVAALRLGRGGSGAKVFYLVRAVTPGTYTVPPPLVEDMYRPDIRGVGTSTPTTITVVQP
ncbi:alpha-2-macroglobulin family protein [Pseudoxanthomonas winnipegensis]|uniref:Alpha-2-macroglobulin n=1 Tax=Pseudoxanthomonas winnipegensis TaxID=2480810 RepID=A0A4Q8LI92_9GAMM|nr:alpha-2-macroglobulin [Pseudoxanthomonas winnipegensis]RZZ87518.1 alpha-2-macroglobulin family protein [Pseudoxanthomonas winnipegensis]TAA29655.1 alpha-2-macroglobulin family protein [Pseudoxanthomonas winnipegensis]TBV76486.1 alpha-2-macroglobulin family protein [Pseudoxanthomonas winnipegensis]